MNGKKNALIVTDGTAPITQMAQAIAAALKKCSVTVVSAAEFKGTALLSSDLCFFGAESAKPASFKYLDTVLQHINLAGRPCGIFSSSQDAAEYLRGMVRDSELALHPVALMAGRTDVKKWAAGVTGLLKK